MITVFKYPFPVKDHFEIKMPKGSSVLSVQVQHGTPCIWAGCDSAKPLESRMFHVIGTGHSLPEPSGLLDMVYRGTFQMLEGRFVGHLFEEVPT